jgi:hypothetical protein
MDDNPTTGWVIAGIALLLCVLNAKRLDRMEKDIRSLADGDTETVKLRRKLDGYSDEG